MEIKSLLTLEEPHQHHIERLESTCKEADGLRGQLFWDKSINFYPQMAHWFLLYDQDALHSVVSVFAPNATEVEINGYTTPESRRMGYFSRLLKVASDEARRYGYHRLVLVCERQSAAGHAFLRAIGATYNYTEFTMTRLPALPIDKSSRNHGLRLAAAEEADMERLSTVSIQIFGGTNDEARQLLEAIIRSPQRTQYVAYAQGELIGIVAVSYENNDAWIIGLGVCAEHRGKGYGRTILLQTLDILQKQYLDAIYIDVESTNETAVKLYRKNGFMIHLAQNYFSLPLR